MPHPWENSKEVEVLYHVTGAVTFVSGQNKVTPSEYLSQWGQMWKQMQEEKKYRANFRRMRLPPFDDEEPMQNWDQIANYYPEWPDAIPLKEEDSDDSQFVKLKDSLPFFAPDHHYSNFIQASMEPPVLYDQVGFEVAKEQEIQLPNGPSFEPPGNKGMQEYGMSAFEDPQRIIVGKGDFPPKVEHKVAYPSLYGNCNLVKPGRTNLPQLSFTSNAAVTRHDNKISFFVDSSITPAPKGPIHCTSNINASSDTDAVPFLADVDIDEEKLAHALALHNADTPLNETEDQGTEQPRRPQDIPLVKRLYTKRRPLIVMKPKTRRSYQRLLKQSVKNRIRSSKMRRAPNSGDQKDLLKLLASTKFFESTKIDWLEAGMQLCHQGHQILQLLIHKRGLHFMHLDYNFNLKPTKTLTTKERKRSRFGNSFHLVRELLKLVKLLVDCRLQYRMGNVDAYELNDAVQYIFTHMGQLTGIYRYKYKVMHQITACNDVKHVIYDRFNLDGVGKGPGCGIWQPMWCIWLGFLRGNLPLLERWLGNLIQRQFFGRISKGISKTVTKQRIDSHYDLELRASVLHDILDVIPESLRKSKAKVVMEHLAEAWRCWKANIPWDVDGMPEPIKKIIHRYIEARAEHWIRVARLNRERIRAGKVVDKAVSRKNLGRLTRLWMRAEQERQDSYANYGPYLDPEDAVVMYKTMANFLRERNFTKVIPFPPASSNDTKLLLLALEGLRDGYNMMGRLSNTQREELTLIEQAYDLPHEALSSIKRSLMSQRVFKNIEVSLLDFHSHVSPVYQVDMTEKIVDAYLDQYLWYEAERLQLFPEWLKPSDDEVTPIMVRKFCAELNNSPHFWDTENDATSGLIHVKLHRFVENCDLTLLNQLLKLIVDANIADYITSKMNASLSFKDMLHVNQFGIIRGLQFSSFVVQFYLMMSDILILGLPRALDLGRSENMLASDTHPIRGYMRYLDEVYVSFHLSRDDAEEMKEDFAASGATEEDTLPVYPLKRCWAGDLTMKMIRRDVALGRALYDELTRRLPDVLGSVECLDASIYSVDNPAILFDMAGFEVRLVPKHGLNSDPIQQNDESMWSFTNRETMERTGFAAVKVSRESINRFENRVRQILMSSGSTTFAKIVKRWNTTLTALATYFREAAVSTPELLDVIVRCEIRVQNKVMMGLNSKMPARFPPCVFYSPEELGGLGMLSASHVMIPSSDIYGGVKQFKFGIGQSDEAVIPNLFRYINSWEAEASDSHRVWVEYTSKRMEAQNSNTRISLEDIEKIWDRGLPRISTLFQKDRMTLAFDKGFRVRQLYKNYSNEKYDPFWWVNNRHDGRLWNFTHYRSDVIQSLGGIQSILEHTLFKGTGFEDWEGLFWQKQSGFEQQMQMQKLTNAQRSGLSQIPNRRFTLWWSPTINRANVYIGFLVQLDLTGIFLHGKIPTLKISYIQIFRAHLWQKIHESLVLDLCQIIDNEQSLLQIESIEKLPIHPRKSYRMNASAADILLKSTGGGIEGWPVSKPSTLNHENDEFKFTASSDFWIDVQLKYGDFDSHDITKYTRAKFLDYTSDGVSLYPSKTGLIVCYDLAYNTYDAYGHWFPGLKKLIRIALEKIKQANPSLFILRERIRKALQLHQTQNQQPHLSASNYLDIVNGKNLLVDDTSVYRVTLHKTKNGNMASKPVNGALLTLNPRTGRMHMQVIHAQTAWAGQKKLSAVSKWKAAEEEAALLRKIPEDEMPQQIVIASRGLRDPMEVNMLEFSGVTVRNSDLKLPFSALLNLAQFKEVVTQASQPSMHQYDLYDDWLDISQPSTAFSRLMLLLRGLLVNPEGASAILSRRRGSHPRDPTKVYTWPCLSRSEWIDVENEMSELVIEEYGKSNGVNTNLLTQSEVRDIILGQTLAAPPTEDPAQERLLLREGEQGKKNNSEGEAGNELGIARATKTHNVHGDEITVVTTSNYEQQQFESRNTWRNRAIEASSSLQYRSQNLTVSDAPSQSFNRVSVPSSLISDFVSISDPQNIVFGLLYGCVLPDSALQVESIAVVPQLGSATTIMLPPLPEELPDRGNLEFLGYVRTQPQPRLDQAIPPLDLTLLGSRNDLKSKVILLLNFTDGDVELQSFKPTDAGINWGSRNRDLLSSDPDGYDGPKYGTMVETIALPNEEGFFYVPQDNVWNYSFMSSIFNTRAEPFMKVGRPLQYFDSQHRAIHFTGLDKLEDGFELEDLDF